PAPGRSLETRPQRGERPSKHACIRPTPMTHVDAAAFRTLSHRARRRSGLLTGCPEFGLLGPAQAIFENDEKRSPFAAAPWAILRFERLQSYIALAGLGKCSLG